jgi:hypothetical protein
MLEAIQTLKRQDGLLSANVRISDRQLKKAEAGSEPYRAASLRRGILLGKLREIDEALKALGAAGVSHE